MTRDQEILQYWFGNCSDETELTPNSPRVKRWFQGGAKIDQEILSLFELDVHRARQGLYKAWENAPSSRLALIILLDQFPRNIYRNTPKSFDSDEQALGLTVRSIADGSDLKLKLIERAFLYLPLMHSEEPKIQNQSLQQYRQLAEAAKKQSPINEDYYFYTLDFAMKHHRVIQKFGRYPHRNSILGRKSTPEELEYLEGPQDF